MAKYKFVYAVMKDGESVFDSEAEVSLTKKNFEEIENFIIEHQYSPEFVDIPAHIYDKIMNSVLEKALREFKPFANLENGYELGLQTYIPESILGMLSEDTQDKVYKNIPEEAFE
jgi:hypothetical protein